MNNHPISTLSIKGFKSIQGLDSLVLGNLNVLIGSNGAGKSNFISFFIMLRELIEQRLQLWTTKQGGADRIVTFGVKQTSQFEFSIRFGLNGYEAVLEPTVEGGFVFATEQLYCKGPLQGPTRPNLGNGHGESQLKIERTHDVVAEYCYRSISRWTIFHFHDTSETAGVKRWGALHDDERLRPDASNLAAFLYRLKEEFPDIYQQIRKTVCLAVPFFDDFILTPRDLPSGEQQIRLLWQQKASDYTLWPSQISDGALRFICLATALLQPDPPSTIIIDEPELGLHPHAIALLGSLLRSASKRMQVIVATQSVFLVNEFSIDSLIIVERKQGVTRLTRHKEEAFASWLEEYSVGELWAKKILDESPRS
ncbi:MAG: AAA family ATPase [Magnetococcales bacterium]|nr:AAA family ATPase [Magnetococcales bacterium]